MRHSTIGSMIGKRSRMTCFFFFVKSRIHLMILVKMIMSGSKREDVGVRCGSDGGNNLHS